MKVMWMGNIILPAIAEKESLPPVYIVGWLVGLSRRLTQLPDVALTYVFDAPKALTGEVDGYRYYGLVNPTRPTQRCGEAYTRQLEEILRKEQPDVIHLWGTENQHTLAMVDAAEHMGMRERIVISIQGLLSIYAEHYRAYLPEHVCHGHTLKDLVKGNIVRQEAIYRRVGQYEQEACAGCSTLSGAPTGMLPAWRSLPRRRPIIQQRNAAGRVLHRRMVAGQLRAAQSLLQSGACATQGAASAIASADDCPQALSRCQALCGAQGLWAHSAACAQCL